MLHSLFLFVSALTLLNGQRCNTCESPVSVPVTNGVLTYQLCLFETAFELKTKTPVDWLFLGTSCDDNCEDTTRVEEGILCGSKSGYYDITEGVFGTPFEKIEYNELTCTGNSLKVDRYMPNLWLKNTTLTYFVASGLGEPSVNQTDEIRITYV